MSIRDDFFTAKAKGSLWDVAVSIKRGNPLPLDADSIFESYAALETYAADVLAYPGQLVAVVEENATSIYYLDQNLAIKPVGIIPSGDSKSIEVSAEGVVGLLGAKDAANGTLPMIGEDGKLTWKTLEDIGAGDGNDNTTYEITALEKNGEAYGIKVQVIENGIASGDPVEIPLDVYTKTEVDSFVNDITDRLDAIEEKEDKDTTYSVKDGEKILKLEGTEFSTVASLKYIEATETAAAKIQLLGIDNAVVSEIDATPFIKDGMLHDVDYNAETNKLIFTWNTDEGEKTDEVILSDIIEPYTPGNGLELSGNEFAIKIETGSETYLSVGENGLKLSGIGDEIDSAISTAAEDATAKANQALADAKADAANLYATKEYVGTIPDSYSETNLISFINKKAEETLAAAQGGSSETAASVKQQLDNYKSENDTKVNANTTAINDINDKLETIAENADVNIIEAVKVNGVALSVAEDKSVDVTVPTALNQLEGYTTLDGRITSAKIQADKGVEEAGKANATAATNAEEIGKHENRLGLLESTKTDHETRISGLADALDTHTAQYDALKETVDNHTTAIAKKAEQSALDTVSAKVAVNETAIQTINETTIPGVLTEVGKKANSTDVYTKAEIGTITEGKTIVGMIADAQTAATYNDTEIRTLINDEIDRAEEAEGQLSARIAKAEAFLNEANLDAEDGSNNVIDTLKEIQEYITKDKTGASGMLASIQANTAAIETINSETNGILTQAKAYTNDQIDALPTFGPVAGALLGLVKSSEEDNKIKVETDGSMSINRISTDKLYVAEGSELVLNGGSAVN